MASTVHYALCYHWYIFVCVSVNVRNDVCGFVLLVQQHQVNITVVFLLNCIWMEQPGTTATF